jgi:small subunit ribosomal protein S20
MANTASARKRIRQTAKRTERNQARKARMRTFIKKVEVALTGGDKAQAAEALRAAQPELQRAAGKGVIHRNTVARKLSRLAKRVKALTPA